MGGAGLIPVAIAGDVARIALARENFLGTPGDFLDLTVQTSTLLAGTFDMRRS